MAAHFKLGVIAGCVAVCRSLNVAELNVESCGCCIDINGVIAFEKNLFLLPVNIVNNVDSDCVRIENIILRYC